jgi:hypothetical protein
LEKPFPWDESNANICYLNAVHASHDKSLFIDINSYGGSNGILTGFNGSASAAFNCDDDVVALMPAL